MARIWKNDFKTFEDDITYSVQYADFKKYYSSINEADYSKGIDRTAYPQKVKFELGDNYITSTHFNSNDNEVFRYVFKGDFRYKKNGVLGAASLSEGVRVYHERDYGDDQYGYRVESKRDIEIADVSSFHGFNEATDKLFVYENIKDDYELYDGDYDVLKGEGKSNILSGEFSSFYGAGWHTNPFEGNLIEDQSDKVSIGLRNKVDINKTGSDEILSFNKITKPFEINKKSADKITNFNPSIDTLQIDSDSFDMGESSTFQSGKNKKSIKKLANKDFDFLYDEKKGWLYFNENGSDKGFGDGGIIAILKGAPDLSADNLEFI